METRNLRINRDIILASKRQHLEQRKKSLPLEAVQSLAQMQRRPRSLLNYASDREQIAIIAQVSRQHIYDPVTSALHCLAHGADAIALYTDHSLYTDDLDDLLMVARAMPQIPLLFQNYVLDEYSVVAARGADASALILYSAVLEPDALRQLVSTAQRWKMSVFVQISEAHELETAISLSPHVLCFGEILSRNIQRTIEQVNAIRPQIPSFVHLMLMHTLQTVDEVEATLQADVDAIIVSEDLLKQERAARQIRELRDVASAKRTQ
jgi:indole-3-glycerol phosphate synthase